MINKTLEERDIPHIRYSHTVERRRRLASTVSTIPGRTLFMDRLERALAHGRRTGEAVAVLLIDIDNFTLIANRLGRSARNLLRTSIESRLVACLRFDDTVVCLNDGQFAVLLSGVDGPADAIRVAGRIHEQLCRAFWPGSGEVFVTASIGATLSQQGYDDPDILMRDAYTATSRARAGGQGRYQLFDQSMERTALARLELENDLRGALERGEFMVHYQPIVDLITGEVEEVEALVRWHHPQRGLVSPAEFIPLAEETGLIVPIGEWVLREACHQLQQWQHSAATRSLRMNVNVSARQVEQNHLATTVAHLLTEYGISPDSLTLELTESAMLFHGGPSEGVLHHLKKLGVRLAIDDFGTGYSSLSYLQNLPVDILKLDRSFVVGLGTRAEDLAIVRAIISLAHALKLQVICEGLERQEQVQILRELGCERGQGYYFARPHAQEELGTILNGQALPCPLAA